MPVDLPSKEAGGIIPVFVADNWDHNERTVSGKGTTHAMTSIVITEHNHQEAEKIPRSSHYTFDGNNVPGKSLL